MQEPIVKARRELFAYLERAAEEQNVSMTALSEKIGVEPLALQNIFSGESNPSLDQVLNLCLALNVDIGLNAALPEQAEDEMPEVLLCEEPVQGSDVYLLHTRHPRSLWVCELMDDGEETEEDDETVDFKTLDGYEEHWLISPVTLYEGGSDDELEKASKKCSRYLKAYLSWEDEDLRKAEGNTFN